MLLPAHSGAGPWSTEATSSAGDLALLKGAANADERAVFRNAQEPFIHRKKSLPGLKVEKCCKCASLRTKLWNTHLQGCVPEKPARRGVKASAFSLQTG
jgi:hypothetical protein